MILCEGGHPAAFFTRDVYGHEMYRHGDLEFIYRNEPLKGDSHPHCKCGQIIYWTSDPMDWALWDTYDLDNLRFVEE
jgi:hypothetical protein